MMTLIRTATLLALSAALLPAELISNGSFESGLTGWTIVDLTDPLDPPNTNSFFLQSGALSPINLLTVPPPPDGSNAAMTDSGSPGSHVLYQDIVIPMSVLPSMLSYSWFINNMADDFFVPSPTNTLDFTTTARNQQARVDFMTTTADPFSVAAADVLLPLFATQAGEPLVSGYNSFTTDITPFLQMHAGETVRLRFAATNNVDIMNFGVDAVSITEASAVPEPATAGLLAAGVVSCLLLRSRARTRG